jgi:hypothetical protein
MNEDRKETPSSSSSSSSLSFSFCEIQAIPTDFGAFLMRPMPSLLSSPSSSSSAPSTNATTSPMMVGNGSLYAVTRMDPLFFLLTADRLPLSETTNSSNSGSSSSNSPWQPLEQILDALQDPALVACLQSHPRQLQHLFDRLNLGGGSDDDDNDDDECFYKFSVTKALSWLTRKQVVVQQVLLQQQQQLQQQADLKNTKQSLQGVNATSGGGSFCSTFNLIPDDKDLTLSRHNSETSTISVEQQAAAAALRVQQEQERQRLRLATRARDESIQIICTYLDDASWQGAFLQHLQVSDPGQVLWGKTSHSTSTTTSIGNNSQNSNKRPASATAAVTGAAFATASTSSTTQKSNGGSNSSSSSNNGAGHASKKPRQTAKSAGVKRLEKAAAGKNKGLQKMTSFFQAVPKKRKEHNENDKN